MPSSMIHLLTAKKYASDASIEFYIGNLAPDAINEWKEKEIMHFRDKEERLKELQEFAGRIDLKDDLSKGILLHLYLDYHWDSGPLENYKKNYEGDNWLTSYRHETALAGAWLFHHSEWSTSLWDEMAEYPIKSYNDISGIRKEDLSDLINRNRKWHIENNIGPSFTFTPVFVENFTDKLVVEFSRFLEGLV
ncbi:hypothetical protein [Natronospora cellulosivora (SeqCode)]